MLGGYIHVPFCSAICNYCNFNRGLLDETLKRQYVAALVGQIRAAAEAVPLDTLYFGGGTPSLLEPREIAEIVAACRASFDVTADAEVTLETNPETASTERLDACRAAGVTRLSFGVQSFRDTELARLGRLHDAARARQAVHEARAAGFENVSLDLMMWLPGQSVADWLESVDALVDVGPEHASIYLLELYPNAPLRDVMAREGSALPPDEEAAEMYLRGFERLDRAGYEQYEISNVARPGRKARHNLKYWQDGAWLAFGCGAHGSRDGIRWCNVASPREYIARVEQDTDPRAEVRRLAQAERAGEAAFMALRLVEGADLDAIGQRYDLDVWEAYGARLEPALELGVLVRDGGTIRLTRNGMLVANEVMSVFV